MKCLQCGRGNRVDAAFCDECGAGLEAPCPGCREPNRLGAKFCRKCGQPLGSAQHPTPIGPGAILRTAETYTPKHLAEKILSSRSTLEGERKQVTVLFADLKGSMELLADRDPEEARKLLDPVLERMMEAVHRYLRTRAGRAIIGAAPPRSEWLALEGGALIDAIRLRAGRRMSRQRLDPDREARFWDGVAQATRFFMGEADVQRALDKLVRLLDDAHIPYAVVGAMALNEYGYRRVTVDVDILLTPQGLESLRALAPGRGYTEQFPGSRGLRDVEHGVPIDVLVAGEYPGDGRPKPVRFPDPAEVAIRGARAALLPLPRLVEIKLASGISAPHRLRDLADVLELIRVADLPAELADKLDPFVREKYLELWRAAQTPDPH